MKLLLAATLLGLGFFLLYVVFEVLAAGVMYPALRDFMADRRKSRALGESFDREEYRQASNGRLL